MPNGPTKGVAIYPDKRVEFVTVNGLADMQAIVDGMIEAVHLGRGDLGTMYVDEEYLYKKEPHEFNSIATDVAGLLGNPHLLFQGVLGPVLVLGPVDEDGYDTDIVEPVLKAIYRVGNEAGAIYGKGVKA